MWLWSLVSFACVGVIVCPPVTKPPLKQPPDVKPVEEDVNFGLEYERYLKEVVNILETDESFRQKLESANVTDIKSGEIAKHLDLVNHGIRSKLDELKRAEIERLRQLVRIKMRQAQGMRNFDPRNMLQHLDHSNPDTFEISDLAKLIKQATEDLEDIDKKRKEEFKEYEMTKEHMRREKLKHMDEAQRLKEQQQYEELQKKHKDHPKLHHPGSRDQLEEVWEENDGYNKDDFDPKAFFKMHDLDGDGLLSESELESLFMTELDKVYDEKNGEDDMVERYEEMNRMREHVMNEVDKDNDKLISLEEFLDSTKGEEFEKDDGWKTLDEEDLFTDEELRQFEEEYERRRLEDFQGQVPPGVVNPPFDPSAQPPFDPNVQHMNQGQPPQFQQPNIPQQPPQFQQPNIPQQPPQQPNIQQAPNDELKFESHQQIHDPNQVQPPQAQPPQGQPPQGQPPQGQPPQGQPPHGLPPQAQPPQGLPPQGQPPQGQPPQDQLPQGQNVPGNQEHPAIVVQQTDGLPLVQDSNLPPV